MNVFSWLWTMEPCWCYGDFLDLNSIFKGIVEAFKYTNCAKELLKELEESFYEYGPLLSQLERDITSIFPGNISIMQYYIKMKRLWDELACLMPMVLVVPWSPWWSWRLQSSNAILDQVKWRIDYVKNQFLIMDPLLSVNKVFDDFEGWKVTQNLCVWRK